MRKVLMRSFGPPDVLELVEASIPRPKPHEVLVRTTSIGMNRADVDCRQGIYPIKPHLPCGIGKEASGIVIQADEKSTFKAGDRVGTLPCSKFVDVADYGRTADYFVADADWLTKTPDSVPDRDAGAIWINYLTAYGALKDVGKLEDGETIVISAASGATGIAAMQIAKLTGARVIATTRSDDKRERLLAAGADHVINTRAEDYIGRVQALTGGRGADFIFDPITGPFVAKHLEAARRNGRVLIYGVLTYPEFASFDPDVLINKHISLRGYTVDDPYLTDRSALSRAVQVITDDLDEGRLRLAICKRFSLEEVVAAHEFSESGRQFGKILINP